MSATARSRRVGCWACKNPEYDAGMIHCWVCHFSFETVDLYLGHLKPNEYGDGACEFLEASQDENKTTTQKGERHGTS